MFVCVRVAVCLCAAYMCVVECLFAAVVCLSAACTRVFFFFDENLDNYLTKNMKQRQYNYGR